MLDSVFREVSLSFNKRFMFKYITFLATSNKNKHKTISWEKN